MTDSPDLERRLRGALQPTEEDHRAADRMVDRIVAGTAAPSTARSAPEETARRPRWVVPLLAASVAACLALGVGAIARMQAPSPQQVATTPGPSPSVVDAMGPQLATGPNVGEVSCGADGAIRMGTPIVEAQPDGVHLRWTTTARTTNVNWGDGGTAVARGTHDIIRPLTPGKATLTCSIDGNATMREVTFYVIDPTGSWLGDQNNLWCAGGAAQPSWVIKSVDAPTPREAVEGLSKSMKQDGGTVHAVGRAPIGYVDSPEQTWTVDTTPKPMTTPATKSTASPLTAIVVDVRRLAADRFRASPNWICERGTVPTATLPDYTPQGPLPAGTPDVIDLSCTDGRLDASATTVRRGASGVTLRSATSQGWSLRWELPTDGVAERRFEPSGSTITESFEPGGTARLWCSDDRSGSVDLRVVDPDGTFLGGSLAHLCPTLTALDTDVTGTGTTPYGAAAALARRMEPRKSVILGRAPLGSVGGPAQYWGLRFRDAATDPRGMRITVAAVTRDSAVPERFIARPDTVCESS